MYSYSTKEDVIKNNGTVTLFNKTLTNFSSEGWFFLFVLIVAISITTFFIFNIQTAFIAFGVLSVFELVLNMLYQPFFAEAMRCG